MADNREPAALTPFDAGKAIALTFVVSAVAAPFLGSRSGIVGDLATSIIAPAVCAVCLAQTPLIPGIVLSWSRGSPGPGHSDGSVSLN